MTHRSVRHEKKAISTIIGSIFMLLIMFGALIAVTVAFFNYNLSANEQMNIEHERSQEKIELAQLDIDNELTITSLTINNTGTIDVKIRALYEIADGETKLLFDPADYGETNIAPTQSLKIYIPDNIPKITFDPQAKLVAATERGIKTLDYVPTLIYGPVEPPSEYDPTKLYIGPLMLKFDDFAYCEVNRQGTPDPPETWQPGWVIDENGYCAWRISIMNIDERNITINRFTSFNLVPTRTPSTVTSWYLEPNNPVTKTQFLQVNQTESVTFIWTTPLSGTAQSMNLPPCTCMVFLTFFGVFHEEDGTDTAYAQTIPFEAAVTVSQP
jgi:hypothetical protein